MLGRHSFVAPHMLAWWSAFVISSALGCGGSTENVRHTRRSGPLPPGTVVSAAGTEVSEEAQNKWQAALATFRKYEREGWNSSRCNDAAEEFERAVEVQGGRFAEAFYMAGVSVAQCGDARKALEFYQRALEVNQDLCEARSAMGVVQYQEGHATEAAGSFQRALSGSRKCAEGYLNLAITQEGRGAGQIEESRKNLRRALAIDAHYLPAFNELALLFFKQATGASEKQLLDLAEIVCRQAQLLNRDYAPIYNTWGLIKVKRGDIVEALRYFEKAKELDPNMFEAHMNFGHITLSFRGYEDAKASFEKAVALRRNVYDAHIGLGMAYRGLRDVDKAKAQYQAAIELEGTRPEAFHNLGILYQDYQSGSVQDLRQAQQYFQQFLAKAQSQQKYAEAVEDVQRQCREEGAQSGKKRRRGPRTCRPGRLQNIETTISALEEAARIQSQAQSQGQ